MAVKHVGAGGEVGVAEVCAPGEAVLAAAAVGDKGEDDPVADVQGRHALAQVDDGAGALVAEDGGGRDDALVLHVVQVAAADARRADLDPDLAHLGGVKLHVFNGQGLAEFP